MSSSIGYLQRYQQAAEAGDEIIGQELMLELNRLVEDIRSGRYIYDTTDADLRMDFLEHCVRLTKSPFYNKPMVLMLWQRAWIEALYSFKIPETGLDRFKKSLLLIARKNAKSETSSGLSLSELFLGKPGSDIVASSNDDAQASIVYDSIDTMRRLIDPKDLDSKRNQRFILARGTDTKVFKLSDRTRNKEGRNIDFAILDEVHEMRDNTIAKSIEQSQSLKEAPKFIEITTEGFVSDGYLAKELEFARAIIRGEKDGDPAAERFLPWLYTQDSEREVWDGNRDNRLWMKSNPSLGRIKRWDYLEEQVALARESKSDRIFVLSKDFNLPQNASESWLNLQDYDYESGFDPEDFRGAFALGAVDLSETTDLTCAKALVQRPGDPVKYVLSQYFIPESKLEESDDATAGAKYKEWAAKDWLTVCEGNDIDLGLVADWFYKLHKIHGIKLWRCGYDQRFAKDWIAGMSTYGWERTGGEDSDLVMILQNAQTLSSATKLCESDFKHRLIYYGNNEMDKWCLGNAGLKVDARGLSLIVKRERAKRIDGAVCFAILYEMYRRYRSEFKALTEKQGGPKR